MKQMIIGTLLDMPNNRGPIKEIKSRLLDKYSGALESNDWESTFAKSLSRYKTLFLKSDAIYKLNSSCDDQPSYDLDEEYVAV